MAGVDGFEQVKEQRSFAGKSRIVLALLQVLGRIVAYLFQCRDHLQYQSLALESVGLAIDHAQAFAHHRFIEGNLFDRWWRGGQHRSARAPPAIASQNNSWSVLRLINRKQVDKLVVIVVNAATNPATNRDKTPNVLGFVDTVTAAATVPLDNYSFDTLEMLRKTVNEFNEEMRLVSGCRRWLPSRARNARWTFQCLTRLNFSRSRWRLNISKQPRSVTGSRTFQPAWNCPEKP